jgi:hypothetical protein
MLLVRGVIRYMPFSPPLFCPYWKGFLSCSLVLGPFFLILFLPFHYKVWQGFITFDWEPYISISSFVEVDIRRILHNLSYGHSITI